MNTATLFLVALVATISASKVNVDSMKQRDYIGKEAANLPDGAVLEGLSVGLDGTVYEDSLKSVQQVLGNNKVSIDDEKDRLLYENPLANVLTLVESRKRVISSPSLPRVLGGNNDYQVPKLERPGKGGLMNLLGGSRKPNSESPKQSLPSAPSMADLMESMPMDMAPGVYVPEADGVVGGANIDLSSSNKVSSVSAIDNGKAGLGSISRLTENVDVSNYNIEAVEANYDSTGRSNYGRDLEAEDTVDMLSDNTFKREKVVVYKQDA